MAPMFPAFALRVVLAAVTLIASQASRSADLFDELFGRTVAKRDSIQSIRAHFTETTTSSLLDKPLVSRGTIVAAPPARVLMTYTDPERRTVVIDGKSLVVVWADRGRRETVDIAQTMTRIDRYFAQATPAELRSMFEIRAEADADAPETIRVDMRPKRRQIKEGLQRLELWVDRQTLLLAQMRMTFAGGGTKRIELRDIETNVPITDGTFHIGF